VSPERGKGDDWEEERRDKSRLYGEGERFFARTGKGGDGKRK